jgi:hypothetical protein
MREESKTRYCQTGNGQWVTGIKDFVKQLRYGEVRITVHDGKVVQVEKTEKLRL